MSIEKIVQQIKKLNNDLEKKINNERKENVYLLDSLKEKNLFLSNLKIKNEMLINKIESNKYELENLKNKLIRKNKIEEEKLLKYYQKLNRIIKSLEEEKRNKVKFEDEFYFLNEEKNSNKKTNYQQKNDDLDDMLKKIGL